RDGDLAGRLALGDPGRLAATVAQVIQLGATDDAATLHFDGVDVRRQDREATLHAFTKRNLADREGLVHAAAVTGDADAFERLDAFALAFLDAHVDAQGVARLEFGDGLAFEQAGFFFGSELLDDVHVISPELVCSLPVSWRDAAPRDPGAAPASFFPFVPDAIGRSSCDRLTTGLPGCRGPRTSAVACTADAQAGRPRSSRWTGFPPHPQPPEPTARTPRSPPCPPPRRRQAPRPRRRPPRTRGRRALAGPPPRNGRTGRRFRRPWPIPSLAPASGACRVRSCTKAAEMGLPGCREPWP